MEQTWRTEKQNLYCIVMLLEYRFSGKTKQQVIVGDLGHVSAQRVRSTDNISDLLVNFY